MSLVRKKRASLGLAIIVLLVLGLCGNQLAKDLPSAYAKTCAPNCIQFSSANWTQGTAQPGDNGALLNVTIVNLYQNSIGAITETLKLGPVFNYLRNATGGNTVSSQLNTIAAYSAGSVIFTLDVRDVSPFPHALDDVPLQVVYTNFTNNRYTVILNATIFVTTPLPLSFVGTGWARPGQEGGGAQGDQGDTLILQLENPNPFPVSTFTGSIPGPISTLTSPSGSASIAATPATSEVLQPNAVGTLNFTVDIPSSAPLGTSSVEFIANYTDQYGNPLSTVQKASVTIVGTGSPVLTVVDNSVSVGSTTPVVFDLTNEGTAALLKPSIVLQAALPLVVASNSTFSTTTPIAPRGKSGSTLRFAASITTGPDVQPQSYPGTLTLTYFDSFGDKYTYTFSVNFLVTGSAQAAVSLDTISDTVSIGNDSEVYFDINDIGSAAMYYPTVTLTVSPPLVIVSGSVYSSDQALGPGGTIDFNASVTAESNAQGGNYPGTITVTYLDQFSVQHTLTFSVGFLVQGSTLTSVSVTSLANTLNVGATAQVVFLIENVGNGTMFSPTFSLQVPAPLVITSNSTFSSSIRLKPLNSTVYEASITVGPGVPVGAYAGTLTVTYNDVFGVEHTIVTPVGFTVSGSTTTSVQVIAVKDTVAVGGEALTSFLIENVGTQPMFDPTISLQVLAPLVIVSNSTFSSSTTIEPGGSMLFTSEVATGPSTLGGAYAGVVVVTYTDQFGATHSQNFAVGFTVSGSTQTTVTVSPIHDSVSVGETSEVSFLVINVGSAPMYDPAFTLQVSAPLVLVSNSTFSWKGTLAPGANVTYTAQVTTGPSTPGGAYGATVIVTYDDAFGVLHTQSLAVGLIVSGSTGTAVSVSAEANTLIVGTTSTVLFQIENIGDQPMYSPEFTLQVASPLVVTSNSTYSSGAILNPGDKTTLEVQVTNGPKTPIAAYTGDLEVVYTDKFGATHSQNFTVGFVVVGTVHLVVLDQQLVQNLDNLTISGTVLNDGTASAFYANVTAVLRNGTGTDVVAASEYIGEVNPTTPVPFTIVIPYVSTNQSVSAGLNLTMQYEDNYRQSGEFTSSSSVSLQPADQLPAYVAAIHARQARTTEELVGAAGLIVGASALVFIVALRRRSRARSAQNVPSSWASPS